MLLTSPVPSCDSFQSLSSHCSDTVVYKLLCCAAKIDPKEVSRGRSAYQHAFGNVESHSGFLKHAPARSTFILAPVQPLCERASREILHNQPAVPGRLNDCACKMLRAMTRNWVCECSGILTI